MSLIMLRLAPDAGHKSAEQALERRQRADHQCYKLLEENRADILAALRLAVRTGLSRAVCTRIEIQINEVLEERAKADAEFLSLLAGDHPVEL